MRRLLSLFPRSFAFFLVTGVAMLLQLFPLAGIFLMMLAAPLWSVPLINLGMLGTAYEALLGRVSRFWLILPVAFYGGYYAFAAADHAVLKQLRAETAAINNKVHIPFDPHRQVLAAEPGRNRTIPGDWVVENFALSVFYSGNSNYPEKYVAVRMVDAAICAAIRKKGILIGTNIRVEPVMDKGRDSFSSRVDERFCAVTLPEVPVAPVFTVTTIEHEGRYSTMPIRRTVMTVRAPDGRSFQVLGGMAAPLRWFPMPVMGCALNSAAPSWDCDAGFLRSGYTPIIDTGPRFESDWIALARALGLAPVAPRDRRGADPKTLLVRLDRFEENALSSELDALQRIVSDPTAKKASVPFGVLGARPKALAEQAEPIMEGLERAAKLSSEARDNGRIFTRLLARLPVERLSVFGPRVLTLYRAADDEHWLWHSDLVARLGDFGPGAVPIIAKRTSAKGAEDMRLVESICRLGLTGRTFGPLLRAAWDEARRTDSESPRLYVAMRRTGVSIPALAENKSGDQAKLAADWGDVDPGTPPDICALNRKREMQSNG